MGKSTSRFPGPYAHPDLTDDECEALWRYCAGLDPTHDDGIPVAVSEWLAAKEFYERTTPDEVERLREALIYLADPESWGGNPLSQEATLYGHDTPFELARAALDAARPEGKA